MLSKASIYQRLIFLIPRRVPIRQWVSLWYFALPILSVGLFIWAPFLHAAYELREKRLTLHVILYGVGGTGLWAGANYLNGEKPSVGPAALTLLLGFTIAGFACWQLFLLRRRVYGPFRRMIVQVSYTGTAPPLDADNSGSQKVRVGVPLDAAAANADRRRAFRRFAYFAIAALPAAGLAPVVFVWPVILVAKTVGNPLQQSYWIDDFLAAFGLIYGPLLIAYLIVRKGRPRSGFGYLFDTFYALIVNIYFAHSVWTIATQWMKLLPQPEFAKFGFMVWWNVLDSVPLVDIDQALGLEQPIENYAIGLGVLLLLQRIVLLATLATTIQFLVAWITKSDSRTETSTSEQKGSN